MKRPSSLAVEFPSKLYPFVVKVATKHYKEDNISSFLATLTEIAYTAFSSDFLRNNKTISDKK